MSNGHDRELGSTTARLNDAEERIRALEKRQERMMEAFHMARGVMWLGGVLMGVAGLIFALMELIAKLRGA